ncbi:hypothetical protein Tco_1194419 [Tanacetum coccineum]
MAEQQTIKYAPQWNNKTVDNPFPSTDETEQCPLREFLIKFSVLNGQRPLTLDFNTFCSSTGLDYNNVLGGNYSSTKQVNSIQKLLAYYLITRTEVDIGEIIYSDLLAGFSVSTFFVCKAKEREISDCDSNLTQSQAQRLSRSYVTTEEQKPLSPKKPPTETKVGIPLRHLGGASPCAPGRLSYLLASRQKHPGPEIIAHSIGMTLLLCIITVPPFMGNFNIPCAVHSTARIFLIPVTPRQGGNARRNVTDIIITQWCRNREFLNA